MAQQISTIAGTGGFGSAATQLNSPQGVYVDGLGNIYIADTGNNRIQKWASGASSGTTVAGTGQSGPGATQLNAPRGVYVDGLGNVYIADTGNSRVQKWTSGASSGTTVAGTGQSGPGATQLNSPQGVYVDGLGNVYIADTGNSRVQKWASGASSGTTVAGVGGYGPGATQLNYPQGVYVNGAGSVYVSDTGNNRIQRWASGTSSGTTVAGTGQSGPGVTQLHYPYGLYIDGSSNVYIADAFNHRIQRWASGANSGTTVAGTGQSGPEMTQLSYPSGVYIDASGNMYITDTGNSRVLKYSPATPPVIVSQPIAGSGVCVGSAVTAQVSATATQTITYQWYKDNLSSPVTGQTSATLTLSDVQTSAAGSYSVVVTSGGLSVTSTAFSLGVSTPPVVSLVASGSLSCTTTSATLTATGGSTYQFSGSGILSSDAVSGTAVVNAPGEYSVTATTGSCTSTTTVTVVGDQALPVVNLTNDGPLSCTNTSVTLTASAQKMVSLDFQYVFSAGTTQIDNGPTASVSAAGVYSVTAIGPNGCSQVASTTVTDASASIFINAHPASVSLTAGQTARFSISAEGSGLSYQWQLDTGSGFVDLTNDATYSGVGSATLTVANTTTALGGYTYRVVVSSGICSATSTGATLTVNRLMPDLIPLMYARPTLLYGTADVSVVVDVVELNGLASQGTITLKISQDAKLSLSLPGSATSVGGRPVSNSVWQLSGPQDGYYTLTTTAPVAAGDKLSVGLVGQFSAGASSGTLPVSCKLLGGSGGEQVMTNNIDADKIDYFQR